MVEMLFISIYLISKIKNNKQGLVEHLPPKCKVLVQTQYHKKSVTNKDRIVG
jgi:hypothetical protein